MLLVSVLQYMLCSIQLGVFSILSSGNIQSSRSYDDKATPAKKEKMIGMYPHRVNTGFQVTARKSALLIASYPSVALCHFNNY